MANKEVVIDHDKIRNSQTITKVVTDEFKKHGLNPHKNDCMEMYDDHSAGKRVYKLKSHKLFGPWSHRG